MVVDVFLLLFLIAPLGLFIHEMGHVLFAMIFRAEKSYIIIGAGRLIYKFRVGKLQVYVRIFFFNGGRSINEKTPSFSFKEKAWISMGGASVKWNGGFSSFSAPSDRATGRILLFLLV